MIPSNHFGYSSHEQDLPPPVAPQLRSEMTPRLLARLAAKTADVPKLEIPVASVDFVEDETLLRGKELIRGNANLLRTLRKYAQGELPRVDPTLLFGPLKSLTDRINSDEGRLDLQDWADYFQRSLDDVDFFDREVAQNLLNSADDLFDVVDITEELLSLAEVALKG